MLQLHSFGLVLVTMCHAAVPLENIFHQQWAIWLDLNILCVSYTTVCYITIYRVGDRVLCWIQ